MIQHGIRWPLATIDFEASALDRESYPVEIGLAIWRGPGAPISTWSSLIEPTPEWVRDGVWFEKAQRIHGISPADLVGAPRVGEVMAAANRFMADVGAVVTDNVHWDGLWMDRLADAAGIRPGFAIEGIVERLSGIDLDTRVGMTGYHARHPWPHRAGPDATAHLLGIAAGIGRRVDVEEWLPD